MIRSKVKYKKISNDDGYIDAQVSKFSLVEPGCCLAEENQLQVIPSSD